MKAVILAAGKGKRLRPFTHTTPKPLLPLANIPLLAYNLESLKGVVDEVVMVIGHLKDTFRNLVGDSYGGMKITYIEQQEQLGTANALASAESKVSGKFLVMMGDDLYSKDDIMAIGNEGNAIGAKEVENPSSFGSLVIEKGLLKDVVEKSTTPPSNIVNTALYCFSGEIFDMIRSLELSKRGEYELTDAVRLLAKKTDVKSVPSNGWKPISHLWDLLDANAAVLGSVKAGKIDAKGAHIEGNVVVGEGTEILPGTVIKGPAIIGSKCTIGPNCYIRDSVSIGNHCRIGNAVEIKDSIIMDHTNVAHLSFVGDSILGKHVNFGAGTKVANLRHDGKTVRVMVDGKLWDSGKRKLGAFIGDYAKTGINTSLLPGRKLDPNTRTQAGEVVKYDILNPSYG